MLFLRIFSLLLLFSTLQVRSQSVRIGTIDVYGNRSISTDTILSRAAVVTGEDVSQKDLADRAIEKRIEKLEGVRLAQTDVVCCNSERQYVLFIGVAENDSSIFLYRKSPGLKIRLPESYAKAYLNFTRRYYDAMLLGQSDDDWSNGYSMIKYPPARRIQERYLRWSNSDFQYLRKILHFSVYDSERATAVQIISYNDDKSKVVPELLYAMKDGSEEVRNNAIKALSAISYYMTLNPGKLQIPFQPFVKMINSVAWSDRNKGLQVLMLLSESRNKELFRQLRQSSLRSLKEMAQWKSEAHATSAYLILARMAGQKDETILKTTSKGNFAAKASEIANALE